MNIKLFAVASAAACSRIALIALLQPAALFANGTGVAYGAGSSHAVGVSTQVIGPLFISNAWARATPPGVTVGAAYLAITNRGKQSDTLVSVSSPVASMVALHRTAIANGLSQMRPAGQIAIAAGETVKVEPGGLHMMLTGLKNPLIAGMKVPLQLTFQQAGEVTVQVDVQPATTLTHEDHASR